MTGTSTLPFKFMQPIQHRAHGFGYFIGTFTDGIHCQIAVRDSHSVQKNLTVLLTDITPAADRKKARQTKPEPDPVLQAVTTQKLGQDDYTHSDLENV